MAFSLGVDLFPFLPALACRPVIRIKVCFCNPRDRKLFGGCKMAVKLTDSRLNLSISKLNFYLVVEVFICKS